MVPGASSMIFCSDLRSPAYSRFAHMVASRLAEYDEYKYQATARMKTPSMITQRRLAFGEVDETPAQALVSLAANSFFSRALRCSAFMRRLLRDRYSN